MSEYEFVIIKNDDKEVKLIKEHYDELTKESGLTEEVILKNDVHSEEDSIKIAKQLNWDEGTDGYKHLRQAGPYLVFPYPYTDDYIRVKPYTPRTEKRKKSSGGTKERPIKYEAPLEVNTKPYIPKGMKEIIESDTSNTPIILTEGEKKALCGAQQGMCCISIAGAWNWRIKGEGDDRDALLPVLDELLNGQEVYITFDSDIRDDSKNVEQAAKRLAKVLLRKNNDVKIIRLPHGKGGRKVGLDDYFLNHSLEDFKKLVTDTGYLELSKKDDKESKDYSLQIAKEIIEHFRKNDDNLLYYKESWWYYTGKCYREIEDESFIEDYIRRYLKNTDIESISNHFINEVKRMIRMMRRVYDDVEPPFRINPNGNDTVNYEYYEIDNPLYVFQNKVIEIDVEGRKLIKQDHSPNIFYDTVLDYKYDKEAKSPRFNLFLREQWNERETRDFVKQVMGYVIGNLSELQKIIMVVGVTASGKSTFTKVLSRMIGTDKTTGIEVSDFEYTFGLESLIGKNLAIANDIQLGRSSKREKIMGIMKQISGGDYVSIQRKNKSAISKKLDAILVLVSNELPNFSDTRGAFFRRLVLLWFGRSFKDEKDPDLEKKLVEELPGIFNMAVEGLWEFISNGKTFDHPEEFANIRKEYKSILSDLDDFFRNRCYINIGNEELYTPKKELYEEYCRYCEAVNYKPWSRNKFSREVKKELEYDAWCSKSEVKSINAESTRVHYGIGLLSNKSEDDFEESESTGKLDIE